MYNLFGFSSGQLFHQNVPDDQIELLHNTIVNGSQFAFVVQCKLNTLLDENIALTVSMHQQDKIFSVEKTLLKLAWIDTKTKEPIIKIEGTLSGNDEDLSSITYSAMQCGDFEEFELVTAPDKMFYQSSIAGAPFFNMYGSLGRNSQTIQVQPLDDEDIEDEDNDDLLYESIISTSPKPNYLAMIFPKNESLELFHTMLRASETLNIPLKVELDPNHSIQSACETAKFLQAKSHRVEIIWCALQARPNSARTEKGRKFPRYALGTILGMTLKRNTKVNMLGIPPLQRPVAGYDFPIHWKGIEQRKDLYFTDENRKSLAEAKVNVVRREEFDTGERYIVSDTLTQYEESASVLQLTNSSEISMYIDNRIIDITKRHLLKSKAQFYQDAQTECAQFLDKCVASGLLVKSETLNGYYSLSITPRLDRPHDAVDIKCGYLPDGCTRVAYLETSVNK